MTTPKSSPRWFLFLGTLALLLAVGLFWKKASQDPQQWHNPWVRVKLLELSYGEEVPLELRGHWSLFSPGHPVLQEGVDLQSMLKADAQGARIGAWLPKQAHLILRTEGEDAIRLGNRWYRGELHLFVERKSKKGMATGLQVILQLPLEDYVLGVVCGEMPTTAEASSQALRAQAVAARSYAAHQLQQDRPWLQADTRDQRFLGIDFETDRAKQAVLATRGLVLKDATGLLPAWFHADCGGATAHAERLGFSSQNRRPLEGVLDPLCQSPQTWTHPVTAEQLDRFAQEQGVGRWIRSFSAEEKDAAGRWTKILIEGERAEGLFAGELLRKAFGAPSLQWTRLTPQQDGSLMLEGYGSGHGVGLCQKGALRRSRAGATWEAILQSYYPGAELHELPPDLSWFP
jgi:stage II sporulation protein D